MLICCLVLNITKYPNIEYILGSTMEYYANPRSPMVGLQYSHLAHQFPDCTGSFHTGAKMLKNAVYGFAKTYLKGKLSLENIWLLYDPKMYYSTIELSILPALAKHLLMPGGINSHPAIAMCLSNKNDCKTLHLIGIDGPYHSKLIPLLYTVSFTSDPYQPRSLGHC